MMCQNYASIHGKFFTMAENDLIIMLYYRSLRMRAYHVRMRARKAFTRLGWPGCDTPIRYVYLITYG